MMHWAGIDFLQVISELVRGRTLNLYPKRPEVPPLRVKDVAYSGRCPG